MVITLTATFLSVVAIFKYRRLKDEVDFLKSDLKVTQLGGRIKQDWLEMLGDWIKRVESKCHGDKNG